MGSFKVFQGRNSSRYHIVCPGCYSLFFPEWNMTPCFSTKACFCFCAYNAVSELTCGLNYPPSGSVKVKIRRKDLFAELFNSSPHDLKCQQPLSTWLHAAVNPFPLLLLILIDSLRQPSQLPHPPSAMLSNASCRGEKNTLAAATRFSRLTTVQIRKL